MSEGADKMMAVMDDEESDTSVVFDGASQGSLRTAGSQNSQQNRQVVKQTRNNVHYLYVRFVSHSALNTRDGRY